MSDQALSGMKVIEYANFISGPFCTKLMADLGAEVIKIEEPPDGDNARRTGPFLNEEPHPERSGLFLYLNTNKFGITLNVKMQKGVEIFKELVKTADVLVENMPPSTMENLRLGYESLHRLNPRLVMTSITPFGQFGPYSHYKANDLICCQMSGLAYHTPGGGVDNPEKEPPLKPGGRQSDFIAGSTAATVTMFAFIACQANGVGQHVDISQQASIACFLRHQVAFYTYDPDGAYQRAFKSRTRIHRGGFGYLPCKDGYVINGSREGYQWMALLEIATDDKWQRDERLKGALEGQFELSAFLLEWGEVVRAMLLEWTTKHTKDEITAMAQARGIPIVPCNSAEDMFREPQFTARDYFITIDHPMVGQLNYPGAPYRLSETPWRVDRPAPLLGQHNEDILCRRLGYSRQELVSMRETGVI